MSAAVPDLAAFAGGWRLLRQITEASGRKARFEGRAEFAPAGPDSPAADGLVHGGLIYEETGVLHLPDAAPMQASRRYLWRKAGPGPGAGPGIAVYFPDGRFFHAFGVPPEGAAPHEVAAGSGAAFSVVEATHWCDPDDYHVRYDFAHWPAWRAEWRVKGPRKDYVMLSEYRRDGIPA